MSGYNSCMFAYGQVSYNSCMFALAVNKYWYRCSEF